MTAALEGEEFPVEMVFSDLLACRLPVVLRGGQTSQNRTINRETQSKEVLKQAEW